MNALCAALVLSLATLAACNRHVEPYDPNEKVEQPDLSKIFPEGAERALARTPNAPPPSPAELEAGAPAPTGMTAAENAGPPIRGTVELAPGATAPGGSMLFVIARAGEAGPPTAVLRVQDPKFPFAFAIGAENRMIAGMPWQGPLRVSARLDLDGNVMTRDAGGLEGTAPNAASPGDTGVVVVLQEGS
jgi:hypothetical protein